MGDDKDRVSNDARSGYDALSGSEQARVRAWWDKRMVTLLADLDYERDFNREGRAYVELDDADQVVHRSGGDRV